MANNRFEGKTVIVAGGLGKLKGDEFKKGIGGACVELLKAEGANVVVTDVDEAVVTKAAAVFGVKGNYKDLLKDRTSHDQEVKSDKGVKKELVWDDHPALSLVNEVAGEFGAIDGVIMAFDYFEKMSVANTTSAKFDEMVTKNVWPVFHLFAALRDQLAKQAREGKPWGKVVNVFSFVGKAGLSMGSAYAGTKGAMVGMNKSLAREFARFANVNAVTFGPLAEKGIAGPEDRIKKNMMITSTDLGQNKDITVDKVAPLAVFLVSPDADCIAGQTFSVDGGLWLKLEQ
jgi:NAD(P)-dependent dehydrogenase (short-subunit alcohol dehydrogenase family)